MLLLFFVGINTSQARAEGIFSIPDVVREAGKGLINTFSDTKKQIVEMTEATSTASTTAVEDSYRDFTPETPCEYFDRTAVNVLILEEASSNAKQKIEKVEETINDESLLRENIFGGIKNLLGLQKKDKVIFREMKNDIKTAKDYYSDLDEKISDAQKYLDTTDCEDAKLEDSKKQDDEIQNLVDDEATYRKQFAGSLKEKVRILQQATKNAKK